MQSLLREVRRRLLRERLHLGTRVGLWATAGLCLFAIPVHLWLHELNARLLLVPLVALWVLVFGWSLLRPAARERCADWADRYLGGHSAFSTALEMQVAADRASPQALAHLHKGLDALVAQARRALHTMPSRPHATRPAVIALASLALLAVVLQMPGRAARPESTVAVVAGRGDSPAIQAPAEQRDAALAAALREDLREQEQRGEGPGRRERPPEGEEPSTVSSNPPDAGQTPGPETMRDSGTAAELRAAPGGLAGASTAGNADPGGREAGTARDGGVPEREEETGATLLASHVEGGLQLDRDAEATRADASQAGFYASGDAGPGRITTVQGPALAAAEPPRAEPGQALGPAATAYVTAYLNSRTER